MVRGHPPMQTSQEPHAVRVAQPSAPAPRLARWLLALACAPLPFLAFASKDEIAEDAGRVEQAAKGHAESLLHASGIPDEELASLRSHLVERDRLLVFHPLDGVPADARPKLMELLAVRMQIYSNLLYPRPREARFCASVDDVKTAALPRTKSSIVVDLRQDESPSPIDGAELVYARREGIRIRHWLLRGTAK
jgi:hypothetical protein